MLYIVWIQRNLNGLFIGNLLYVVYNVHMLMAAIAYMLIAKPFNLLISENHTHTQTYNDNVSQFIQQAWTKCYYMWTYTYIYLGRIMSKNR